MLVQSNYAENILKSSRRLAIEIYSESKIR